MTTKFTHAIFVVFVLGYSVLAYMKPFHAWDLIPYIGCAVSMSESDESKIHQITYETVKSSVSDYIYSELTTDETGIDYRYRLEHDPHAFYQQLNFYRARYLYTSLIFFAWKTGLPVLPSMVLISVLSGLVTMLLIYFWFLNYFRGIFALAISLLLVCVSGILGIARWTTPDALSTMMIVLALYMCVARQRLMVGCLILMASILVRPDNIILFGFVVTAYLGYGLNIKKWMILLGAAGTLFLVLSIAGSTYVNKSLLDIIFVYRGATPGEAVASFSVLWYIKLLFSGFEEFYESRIAFFVFMVITIFGTTIGIIKRGDICLRIAVAVMATAGLRYLLFPCFQNRHFVAINILLGLTSIVFLWGAVRRPHRAGSELSKAK